jgi:hypothetical protein
MDHILLVSNSTQQFVSLDQSELLMMMHECFVLRNVNDVDRLNTFEMNTFSYLV